MLIVATALAVVLNNFTSKSILAQSQEGLFEVHQSLSEKGIKFFDYSEASSGISINLYDESRAQVSLVTLKEIQANTIEYKIQSLNNTASVQIKKTEENGRLLYEGASSNGNVSKIAVQISSVEHPCPDIKKVSEVNIATGNTWESFPVGSDSSLGNEILENKLKSEDERLYNTPQLKILQDVILNLTKMQQLATGSVPSEYYQPDARSCGVRCYRVISLTPLFICDGGLWNNCRCSPGGGVFIIGGGCNIICEIRCTAFYS